MLSRSGRMPVLRFLVNVHLMITIFSSNSESMASPVASKNFISKTAWFFWWGLQNVRTVKALNEVKPLALNADELKFVASQFRRLHSRGRFNTRFGSTHSNGGHGRHASFKPRGGATSGGRWPNCYKRRKKKDAEITWRKVQRNQPRCSDIHVKIHCQCDARHSWAPEPESDQIGEVAKTTRA
ncbi:hypothetical protein ZIOFF_039612 [Zingiber officinale]|uniref:Uncharacterized protein n=1 Tax=Zingiber officinale TaxID=94328 RepID=A0A8J5GBH4_ZINOF|nr:hypothetical protein ZIOFF_039612 [Zingiber officinale]